MTYAKGHYDSNYGRIESGWEIKGDKWVYSATVPANSSAILYLPNSNVKENGKEIKDWEGLETVNDELKIPLTSGQYTFEIKDTF